MTTLNLSSAPLTFHSAGGSYEIRVSDGFGGFYTEGHNFGTDGSGAGKAVQIRPADPGPDPDGGGFRRDPVIRPLFPGPGLRRWSASGRGAAMQRCALTLPWQTVRLKG